MTGPVQKAISLEIPLPDPVNPGYFGQQWPGIDPQPWNVQRGPGPGQLSPRRCEVRPSCAHETNSRI